MGLETPLIGEAQHLIVHPSGVSDPQNVDTPIHKFLTNPVYSHITLRANEHLTLAHQRLIDSFYQCRGLAGARRSVDDSHVLSPQHLVYGPLLSGVEPWKSSRLKGESLRFSVGIEQFAQLRQPIILGRNHSVERVEHRFVARFVERQLHTDRSFGRLKVEQRRRVGHNDNHAVTVYVGNRAREVIII